MVSEKSEGVSIHVNAGETDEDIKRWAAEDEAKAKADAEAKAAAAAAAATAAAASGQPSPATAPVKRSLGGLSARAALAAKAAIRIRSFVYNVPSEAVLLAAAALDDGPMGEPLAPSPAVADPFGVPPSPAAAASLATSAAPQVAYHCFPSSHLRHSLMILSYRCN
jgi:hypothetical protein